MITSNKTARQLYEELVPCHGLGGGADTTTESGIGFGFRFVQPPPPIRLQHLSGSSI